MQDTSTEPQPNEMKPTENERQSEAVSTSQPVVSATSRTLPRWALSLFALLVLAGGGVAAYTLTRPDSVPEQSKQVTTIKKSTAKAPASTSTDIMALLTEAKTAIGSGTVNTEYVSPDYMVPGSDFYAVGRKEDSHSLVARLPEAQLKPTAAKLETLLVSKKFQKSSQQVKDGYYPLVKYESDDTFCGINYYADLSDTDKPLYLACALKTSYLNTSTVQKPFYQAYRESSSAAMLTEDNRLGYPKTTTSKTPGYKTAELSLYGEASPTGAMGLFYMLPDNTWHYFRGTQQILPCTEFNTADLKKAYLGTGCYNEIAQQDSTVQL